MKELSNKIQSSLKNIIERKTKAIKAGESRADDLLGILLESISKEQCENGSKEVPISLDDVIGECKLFYFAGQETTSNLLVWTLVLLSIHQNWQTRARKEILQVIGNQEQPNFDHLSRLKVVSSIDLTHLFKI